MAIKFETISGTEYVLDQGRLSRCPSMRSAVLEPLDQEPVEVICPVSVGHPAVFRIKNQDHRLAGRLTTSLIAQADFGL